MHSQHMSLEVAVLGGPILAVWAGEGPLPRMCPHVALEVPRRRERLAATVAVACGIGREGINV